MQDENETTAPPAPAEKLTPGEAVRQAAGDVIAHGSVGAPADPNAPEPPPPNAPVASEEGEGDRE